MPVVVYVNFGLVNESSDSGSMCLSRCASSSGQSGCIGVGSVKGPRDKRRIHWVIVG